LKEDSKVDRGEKKNHRHTTAGRTAACLIHTLAVNTTKALQPI